MSSTEIKKPAPSWLISPSIDFHSESHVTNTNERQPPDIVEYPQKYTFSEEKVIEVFLYRYHILLKADRLTKKKSHMQQTC